jgi:hypothetical protein
MCQDLASEADDIMLQAKNALARMQSYEGCLQLIQKARRREKPLVVQADYRANFRFRPHNARPSESQTTRSSRRSWPASWFPT